ncbi:zinc finger CCHC domain-containing protein 7-like [Stegodyphus dumicola]|uniref:zinc finger CCHC domain-containing protein 7-like n=1 Tax=Stegodyphus dumicola TaxID=202533 RepID=UPI0015B1BE8B|nr:zinc finger CCHC domain-containing protein 7-like [Stegodyphus dumicola]
MMLGIWNYSDHDFASSSDESFDSDKIDSDVEAELYGVIHHQEIVASPDNSLNRDASLNAESEEKRDMQQNSFTEDTPLSKNNQCTSSLSSFLNNSTDNSVETCLPKAHSTPNFNTGCHSIKRKSDLSLENSSNVTESTQCNSTSNKKLKTLYQNKELHRKFANGNHTSEYDDSLICEPAYSRKDDNSSVVSREIVQYEASQDEEQCGDEYVILESSDSDSIIWSEPDEQSRDLKTNVLGDTVSLSSDSPIIPELMQYTSNMSLPNIRLLENSTDPWHINAEDLFRSKKRYSGRYHEKAVLNCTSCKQKGHTSKSCPIRRAVKCFICGDDHNGARCKKRICGKCYYLGHDTRRCWKQDVSLCIICGMDGHHDTECPDSGGVFISLQNPLDL